MKIYFLERLNCDEKEGMVLRASSSKNARLLASEQKGMVWLDCKQTSCRQISSMGREEIIVDFSI